MNLWTETFGIARIELRRGVASGRWLAVALLWLVATALSLVVLVAFTRNAHVQFTTQLTQAGADAAQSAEQLQQGKRAALGALSGDDSALADMLAAWPMVLLIAFKSAMRLLPLLAALMGFDVISSDVASRTVRFYALRVERLAIVLGKYVAQLAVLVALALCTTTLTAAAAVIAAPDFDVAMAATAWAQISLASVVEVATYAALTLLCSALVRSGALAWVLNIGALFGLWLVAVVGESQTGQSVVEYVRFASVWHFAQDLVNPNVGTLAVAVVAHLAWVVAFVALGAFAFTRRSFS